MALPNGPIEVWLRQDNMAVSCTVVAEDETTQNLDVHSLSLRGAEREITGWLISQAYSPVGRWQAEDEDTTNFDGREVVRRFRRDGQG